MSGKKSTLFSFWILKNGPIMTSSENFTAACFTVGKCWPNPLKSANHAKMKIRSLYNLRAKTYRLMPKNVRNVQFVAIASKVWRGIVSPAAMAAILNTLKIILRAKKCNIVLKDADANVWTKFKIIYLHVNTQMSDHELFWFNKIYFLDSRTHTTDTKNIR